MSDFLQLLKSNRNYRYTWSGQVVSEIGDHFNNVAVFSLALANTRSGMVVTKMCSTTIVLVVEVFGRDTEAVVGEMKKDAGME